MGQDRQEPVTATDREELIYLLSEASELEHGLCCCYLFAAFSLKRNLDEDLTPSEHDAVVRWERVISGVAAQEMLHLALASNLLTALGAAPHLRRPNFPQRSKYYPPTLQLTLRGFDERTLDHFIFIERPEGMDFPDAPGFEAIAAPPPLAQTDGIEPFDIPYASVAQLYRDIEQGFKSLCAKYGEDRVFIGSPRAQATSAYFPFPDLVAVNGLASALKVIELIVEQGEGLRGDIENSHYARFLAIRGELDMLRAGRSGFEPARAVIENPHTQPPPDATGFNLVDNPQTRRVSDLFNASYALMVEMLMRFFGHTEETHDELHILAGTALGLMRGVLRPLGSILTTLPATAAGDPPRAGASFAFYRSIDYLPHRDGAWTVFAERLTEIASFCDQLGLDSVQTTLQTLLSRFTDAQDRRVRSHPPPSVPGAP
jgi:ferritin-like protein